MTLQKFALVGAMVASSNVGYSNSENAHNLIKEWMRDFSFVMLCCIILDVVFRLLWDIICSVALTLF